MDLEPDSLRVSTWPKRTSVENSSPSRTTHSAAVAPPAMARATMSCATSRRSVSSYWFLVSSSVGVIGKSFNAEVAEYAESKCNSAATLLGVLRLRELRALREARTPLRMTNQQRSIRGSAVHRPSHFDF